MHERAPMVTKKKPKAGGYVLRVLLVLMLLLASLIFETSPIVGPPRAPSAAEVEQARNLYQNVHMLLDAQDGPGWISASEDDLRTTAVLASRLHNLGRFDASVDQGRIMLFASRAFGPLWFNVRAAISPSEKGFPPVALTIGDLPLGQRLSGWAIRATRSALVWRGMAIPSTDDLVRAIRIDGKRISAMVHLPRDGRLMRQLSATQRTPIDAALTAKLYCRLVADDSAQPTNDLAVIVRRAFVPITSSLPQIEQHRAALVALAMYTVAPNAGRLAGDADKGAQQCPTTRETPKLAGRVDLAKHWTLSAALAASLGDDIGLAMGEWKELADSRPGGTGFSFVDLAADRSGLALARALQDPARADSAVARLRAGTQGDLLPLKALALSEGMSETRFIGEYRTVDSAEFARAKARIDAVIAGAIGG